ncbi:uncharacterized protein THITE_2109218 [Thermothielavioides terrestris NRRL 8126]|uniref:SHSP domain-containing protein n=1 Tax=Thermothielavioides terrestris (strain ATCC 38088 / NRRL 8126) TaxID=578455 RepID=G2QUD3_THETT|nr:uncharacterized protein THITE_2109218 [Thermothielavioides terrestris NRRL 8126]AEO63685.1 hypothetical protein THITE_2109218 [Thermothielavioides terrestris NRRL 8126]
MSLWHPRFSHTHSGAPGFSSLFRMLDDFDRYAAQQLGKFEGSTSVATFSPRFDLAEHNNKYVLQGELPGVAPQNVEIEFTDDQTLVVRGRTEHSRTEGDPALLEGTSETKRVEGGEQKPRYWLSERSYGEFSRVFTFPAAVDQDKVQAKFKDGVLDITVPKAEKRGGKRITIQ